MEETKTSPRCKLHTLYSTLVCYITDLKRLNASQHSYSRLMTLLISWILTPCLEFRDFSPHLNNHKVNFSDEKKQPDITNMKPEQSVTAPLWFVHNKYNRFFSIDVLSKMYVMLCWGSSPICKIHLYCIPIT